MITHKILQRVQFVVDQAGKPTAAVLDMGAWESFLSLIEEPADIELVRARLKNRRTKEGWTCWEDFEAKFVLL